MSREQANACIEKMKIDEAFRAKVLAPKDVAERVQVINAEGFACSVAEIEAVSQELNDADLERVAGGKCDSHCSAPMGTRSPLAPLSPLADKRIRWTR